MWSWEKSERDMVRESFVNIVRRMDRKILAAYISKRVFKDKLDEIRK